MLFSLRRSDLCFLTEGLTFSGFVAATSVLEPYVFIVSRKNFMPTTKKKQIANNAAVNIKPRKAEVTLFIKSPLKSV